MLTVRVEMGFGLERVSSSQVFEVSGPEERELIFGNGSVRI